MTEITQEDFMEQVRVRLAWSGGLSSPTPLEDASVRQALLDDPAFGDWAAKCSPLMERRNPDYPDRVLVECGGRAAIVTDGKVRPVTKIGLITSPPPERAQ